MQQLITCLFLIFYTLLDSGVVSLSYTFNTFYHPQHALCLLRWNFQLSLCIGTFIPSVVWSNTIPVEQWKWKCVFIICDEIANRLELICASFLSVVLVSLAFRSCNDLTRRCLTSPDISHFFYFSISKLVIFHPIFARHKHLSLYFPLFKHTCGPGYSTDVKNVFWILIAKLYVCQGACVSSVNPAAHMVFYNQGEIIASLKGESQGKVKTDWVIRKESEYLVSF